MQAATGGRNPETPADFDGRAGAAAGAEEAKRRVSDNVSESTKSRARDYADRTKDYMAQKMPKERREQVIWRLKKMVLEIQGRADCEWTRAFCVLTRPN